MTTDFQNKEIPNAGSNNTCLEVITIDSILEKDENYHPQVHLKECKYIEKEVFIHVTRDMEICSTGSDEN